MLRFFRIVHPKKTKLSFPRLKSTSRVSAGCSVSPSRFITNPIRRSASLARQAYQILDQEIRRTLGSLSENLRL
jgi:hypothetical protein